MSNSGTDTPKFTKGKKKSYAVMDGDGYLWDTVYTSLSAAKDAIQDNAEWEDVSDYMIYELIEVARPITTMKIEWSK